MNALMPANAPLVVLMFLGTLMLGAALGLLFVYALWMGKKRLARGALLGAIVLAGLYGGIVIVASLASEERTLALGDWKYFCEIDCHVAYSVSDVEKAKTLGEDEHAATANGTFYVVTLKTWFDPGTISKSRPDVPLTPDFRMIRLIDQQGRRFSTSLPGSRALTSPQGENVPLTQPLRPGESYLTRLVFDLPGDVREPRLFVTTPFPETLVLIGHENSLMHKKIYFALEPQRQPVSSSNGMASNN